MASSLLLLSVSAGNGHVRAAEALAARAASAYPDIAVLHIDLMTLVPTLFRKTYKDAYLKLVQKHPALWGYLYARTDRGGENALSRLRRSVESASNKTLLSVLEEFTPDHIVCTHFMPLQVLLRWREKGRISQPVWTCITDFVAHRYWLEPGADGYFTATDEDAWRLRSHGLDASRIVPTGIPVMPGFRPADDPAQARAEAAAHFGLDAARPICVLMGGGAGVGHLATITDAVLGVNESLQVVVLAGRNTRLLQTLRQRAEDLPGRLYPMGFTDEVPALLRAADFVITKPGGLTTVECLAVGRPLLVFAPIPGQEEHNSDYLLENGAALKAEDLPGLTWRVRRLLDEPGLLPRLSGNALALGRPDAAGDVLRAVLGR